VFLLLAVFAEPLATLASRGRISPLLVRLAAVEALVITANGTTGAALLLSGRPQLRAWALAWTNLFRVGFVLLVVPIGTPAAVLSAFIAASLLGALVQAAVAWRHAWRHWDRGRSGGRLLPSGKELALFGLNSSLTTSIIAARLGIMSVILGRGPGPIEVGLFHVAMFPVTLAAVLTAPIRITMFPEHARLAATNETAVLWRSIRTFTAGGVLLGVAGAIGGWFLLPWLLPALYGQGFTAAVLPSRILLVAAIATVAVAWAKALPAAVGQPSVRTLVSAGELAGTAVLMWALADLGAVGGAITVACVSSAVAFVWWILARRILTGTLTVPTSLPKTPPDQ
jgi:O-antigen/teichoic acid export membrane protein